MSAPAFPRTPAGEGFVIQDGHRAANGNIQWRLIWRDFAGFLGLTDADLVSHDPLWLRDKLSIAAIARGYDYSCVGALLNPYVRADAISYAAALGFDPIYLWPAMASKWPHASQRLPMPLATARGNLARITAELVTARAKMARLRRELRDTRNERDRLAALIVQGRGAA
jgi:hypothetical protein